MKVLLAHPGTQYSFQLANQLYKNDLLGEFYTGVAFGKDSWVYKLASIMPAFIYKKISNRFIDDVPDRFLKRNIFIEAMALMKLKLGKDEETVLYHRNRQFQKHIPIQAIDRANVVIGFDTSSWILEEKCKSRNRQFILDVSIGHPVSKEKIYTNLSETYPDWRQQTIPKKKEFIELECSEMDKADTIVVPSKFVKQTLEENTVLSQKIEINPFGTFVQQFSYNPIAKRINDKIIFLFLGSFTARKGLPFLLDTWNEMHINNAELIIAGYGKIPEGIQLPANVRNMGVIAQGDRQALFDSAHVFLFPSFFEGLAQVQLEAMACGLPVVGTRNSGANEIVDEAVNGFIIEAGSKPQLKNAINFFLNSPGQVNIMGEKARTKAEQFSWDNYGKRWKELLEAIFYKKNIS